MYVSAALHDNVLVTGAGRGRHAEGHGLVVPEAGAEPFAIAGLKGLAEPLQRHEQLPRALPLTCIFTTRINAVREDTHK